MALTLLGVAACSRVSAPAPEVSIIPQPESASLPKKEPISPMVGDTSFATRQTSGVGQPVIRRPASDVQAPFSFPPGHSAVVAEDQRAGSPTDRDLDAFSLHTYRSPDADAPALEAMATTRQAAKRLALADQPLVVQTAPGALVAFHAAALGTFASGHNGIVVKSDDTGIARVWFRTGQDAGAYEIMAVSPARSGVVVFNVDVE